MTKAIYKNFKTGKYYTFEKNEKDNTTTFIPVFAGKSDIETKESQKVDSKGKVYWVKEVVEKITKTGHKILVTE